MTIDARRKKNQKKKLKQKEKKAAASRMAANDSIGHEDPKGVGANDVQVADAQEDHPIVDRLAAEEVLPANLFKERNPDMTPQNTIDRSRSPQLVPEPMGQAMEVTPDLDYEELDKGQENSDDSYDDNDEAVEIYDDYIPARRISSQSHHRSRSLSAITAPHLSEDTSENDVLLEGSIERRVSLQNKRQLEEDRRQSEREEDSTCSVSPEELSQRSKINFNLPSGENAKNSGVQASFPFPSRRLSVEQVLSPNEVPRDLKRSDVEGGIPPIENQKSVNNSVDEDDQREFPDSTRQDEGEQIGEQGMEIQKEEVGGQDVEKNEESDKVEIQKEEVGGQDVEKNEESDKVEIQEQTSHERSTSADNAPKISQQGGGIQATPPEQWLMNQTSDAECTRKNTDVVHSQGRSTETEVEPSCEESHTIPSVNEEASHENIAQEEALHSQNASSQSNQTPPENSDHHSIASYDNPPESENQVDELFKNVEESGERMPWETAEPEHQTAEPEHQTTEPEHQTTEPECQIPVREDIGEQAAKDHTFEDSSKSTAQADVLFSESDRTQQHVPWKTSEESDVAPRTISDSSKIIDDKPKPAGPRKFSFLEEDDDLLDDDDDDDSYLESDEEDEDEKDQTIMTVASELAKTGQRLQVNPPSRTASIPPSPISSHGATSKYRPSNLPQPNSQSLQNHGLQPVMPLQAVRESSKANVLSHQNEVPTGFVARQRQAIEGQNVIEKINEEKKKSDAFDFPMDLVNKRTERVPAKPVGVPSSRVSSPPPFEVSGPPRGSRQNSAASLPSNPYAAAAHTSKSRMQSPLPPQGVVLPQNALPFGNQLPSSQLGPVPGSRKSSVRSQYAHGLRARAFSNASSNGSVTANPSVPFPPRFSVSPPPASVIPPASKYAPASPLRPPIHPQTPRISRPMSEKSAAVPSVNIGTSVGGPYAPNTGKSLPFPSTFSKGNIPHKQGQNVSPSNVSPIASHILPTPAYNSNIETTGANAVPEAYPRSSTGGGPPIGVSGKKSANRSHARSNSSIYAPNQNEHTSKYAPTVHPQYQHSFPSESSEATPNTLSAINAYMKSSQPQELSELPNDSVPTPIDNEALLQHQFPLFSWSSSDKFLYGCASDNGQNAFLLGSCSSIQEFSLVNVDRILGTKNLLKSFPGPLINNKTKRKDLQKYLEDHTNEFFGGDNESGLLLLSLLKLKLADNVSFKDIARLLYNPDELLFYLSRPTVQSKQGSRGNKLDANSQMRVCAYLQTGGQEEALRIALERKDFSMALLIGSLMGKEKWSEVVKSYLSSEIEMSTGNSMSLTNLLSLVFQVFVGSSTTAFQEFYINEEKGKWASENWRMVVSAVLNNVTAGLRRGSSSGNLEAPPVVVEFLVEYGVFLHHKQMRVPASILFMIANLPLSSKQVVSDVDVKFEFIGCPYSLEGMLFSEIYEFCISDSKAFPILLPQKLYHAACLQEQGLNTAAQKYTDYLNNILKTLPKRESFSINLTNQLHNLTAAIAGTSTSWLGKPKLSSVWGHLDKSFNKFIGGDDDSLIKKSSGKKVFDGFTPMSSRNNSILDLSQTPFVPYNGHSKKPSFAQSDVSAPASIIGHSPVRNSATIEEASNVKGQGQPEPYVRRSSHITNNYQSSPKVSQYGPSRPNNIPPKLRRVHTMQPLSGIFPQRPGLSSEALVSSPNPSKETNSNENSQYALDPAFSEGEELSMKKQHYSSTPNLLRRASGVSETSSVRKVSLSAAKKMVDAPLLREELKEASVESDLYLGSTLKAPMRTMVHAGQQSASDRPAAPVFNSEDASPISTVATRSPATEDEAGNSDTEHTLSRTDRSSWKIPPLKNGPSVTSSPIAMTEMASGETFKKIERPSADSLPSASALADRGTAVTMNPEEGLGIRLEASKPNPASEARIKPSETKINPPPVIRANPYAPAASMRKASYTRRSYLPKSVVPDSSSRTGISDTSDADLNGLHIFRDETSAVKQPEDKPASSSPSLLREFTTPTNARSHRLSRFNPAEEPEEVSAETFEPVIKRTPKMNAFSPAVVQPPETQYDDVVEDESDESDDEQLKRRKELEERKAKEEEEKRRERIEKASRREHEHKRSGGWFSWLKKDPNEKKPIKAKLGNKKRTFYYDEKLKRWVNNNSTEEDVKKLSTPPPPPPIVKRMDNGPKTKPRSGSLNTASKPAAGAVAPKNPITGESLVSPAPSSSTSQSSSSQRLSAASPPTNKSGISLSGRKGNGLDDLLNLTGGTPNSTRRKKKPNRGYVNVMETR